MIKYRTFSSSTIEAVEVVRETKVFVWLPNGRRESKISDWRAYFDTWPEAHKYLVDKQKRNVELDEQCLKSQKKLLAELEAMKMPGKTEQTIKFPKL